MSGRDSRGSSNTGNFGVCSSYIYLKCLAGSKSLSASVDPKLCLSGKGAGIGGFGMGAVSPSRSSMVEHSLKYCASSMLLVSLSESLDPAKLW